MDNQEERIIPNDRETENIVLGCLMVNKVTLNKFIPEITEDLFFFYQNKIVCKAIIELCNKNTPIDVITVSNRLKEKNEISLIDGGVHYIISLTTRIVSTENFEFYLLSLKEMYMKRFLLDICSRYIEKTFDGKSDSFDLIFGMQGELDHCIKNSITQDAEIVKDIHIRNVKESLLISKTGIASGVKTGLRAVDTITNGWQKSDLIIIAGRPSMGKTALAMNLALHPSINDENHSVLVFSLEMSKEQLVGRLESLLSEIDVSRIIKKQLQESEIRVLDEKCHHLYKAPLYIDDTANISLIELKSKARKMHIENNIKLIVIDYLQLMRSGLKIGNREQEIAEISRGLKSLAKELDIPIIALSQLSRVVESRADKKPMLSDLRESGQIEQDADMVIFCYRPEYYQIPTYDIGSEQFDTRGLFMLLFAKHRNGELGEIPLSFVHNITKVTNFDSVPVETPNNSISPLASKSPNNYFDNDEF